VVTGVETTRTREGSTIRGAIGEITGEEAAVIINMKDGVAEEGEGMTRETTVSTTGVTKTTEGEGTKVTGEEMTDASAEVEELHLSERKPWKVNRGRRGKRPLYLHQQQLLMSPLQLPDRKRQERAVIFQGLNELLKESAEEKGGEGKEGEVERQDHLGGEESDKLDSSRIRNNFTILAIIRRNNTCSKQ